MAFCTLATSASCFTCSSVEGRHGTLDLGDRLLRLAKFVLGRRCRRRERRGFLLQRRELSAAAFTTCDGCDGRSRER